MFKFQVTKYIHIPMYIFNSIHLSSYFMALIFICLFIYIHIYFYHYNDYIITVFSIQRDYISLLWNTVPWGKSFFEEKVSKNEKPSHPSEFMWIYRHGFFLFRVLLNMRIGKKILWIEARMINSWGIKIT